MEEEDESDGGSHVQMGKMMENLTAITCTRHCLLHAWRSVVPEVAKVVYQGDHDCHSNRFAKIRRRHRHCSVSACDGFVHFLVSYSVIYETYTVTFSISSNRRLLLVVASSMVHQFPDGSPQLGPVQSAM
uniref:p0482D04.11 protein n=1 Tax=Oryza sativa subsp. japonica TaxID=39947 RepID=Q8S1Y3_ORYSJ|nr:P0482D04.11 [Oryza sativa Japonica Group]